MTAYLTSSELRAVAARASTIAERLARGCIPEPTLDGAFREAARSRLAAWKQSAAAGDAALFARRLAEQGFDDDAVLPWLGPVRLPDGAALPSWAQTFQWVVAALGGPAVAAPPAGPDEPAVPFEDLFRPVAAAASARLADRLGDRWDRLLTDAARAALERGLLRRLAIVGGPGLFGDFAAFRHLRQYRPGVFALPFLSPRSRAIYDAWLAAWRAGRCRDVFLAKPVAARLIGTAVDHWLDATAELLLRLDRDLPALAETFFGGEAPGPVAGLNADVSDPHRRGRSVVLLRFADGGRLVYKPKDLDIDAAWAGLLGWLDRHGAPTPLKAPTALPRDGYGWAGFIAADTSGQDDDPARFHHRAGGLLAVLHLLRGTDFHQENVIASGGHPVLIDLETLLQAEPTQAHEHALSAADRAAAAMLRDSVLGTHYLPGWMALPGGRFGAIGGLVAPGEDDAPDAFRHVNTDAMTLAPAAPDEAVPSAPAGLAGVRSHGAALLSGFTEYYRFLQRHRDAIAAPHGPLAPFRDVRLRVVRTATISYALLLRRARAYRNLDDGVAWSLHFDFLLRSRLAGAMTPVDWAIHEAERAALANGDIPMFTARADAEWLQACSGERIDNALTGRPFDQTIAHVRRFGDADLNFQEKLIRGTIGEAHRSAQGMTSIAGFESVAARLGALLAETAIRVRDDVAWIGLAPLDHDHQQVSVIGNDLYAGKVGVAVFLAALARQSGCAGSRALAVAAIGATRRSLASADGRHIARLLGIGGGSGLGSIVYGLTRIAGFLDEPGLLDDARRIAGLIDDDLIAADRAHDVIGGAAGAILGLLALHRACGDSAVLDRASACGRHLLETRITDASGQRGWHTLPGVPRMLTGFAHGSAGMALALLRLGHATDDPAFRAAAADALRHERRLFMPGANNWPDLRAAPSAEATEAPCQWCYGASGIGLARLGCRAVAADEAMDSEIEAALACTRAVERSPLDDLCCGEFGRVDFLLTAGIRLGRPALLALARDRARALLGAAEARGGFAWLGGDDAMNPSLFRGIAGIGYTLLRVAAPATLPSVLLWE
jgi:type 2 lantibiotic biosynthesis protein LanM